MFNWDMQFSDRDKWLDEIIEDWEYEQSYLPNKWNREHAEDVYSALWDIVEQATLDRESPVCPCPYEIYPEDMSID